MKIGKSIGLLLMLVIMVVLLFGAFEVGGYIFDRKHGKVKVEANTFKESAKELDNPNRGFYHIYGFAITDEEQDYEALLAQKFCYDQNTLAQIQINLRAYPQGKISEAGMDNVEALFQALARKEKQYIIRFLYDWSGKGKETEPESIDIILQHMNQLKIIFHQYKDIIFVHQGIFVGDCGEMHGSKYLSVDDMETLMRQLVSVTADSTYLSVRTPQHWRNLTKLSEVNDLETHEWAYRLGLYNDGMMGTSLDTGTYGTKSKEEAGTFEKWNRVDELSFQEQLCKIVPNGGEVIIENPMNDFANAVQDLATMHVTYLNRQYDKKVLNKWAETIVTEEGCFHGMDGLSYVERHLGYRLLIKEVELGYEYWQDVLKLNISLQNVGFAPMYKKPDIYCVLMKEDGTKIHSFQIQADVRELAGGKESDKLLTVSADISLAGYTPAKYDVYFYMKDPSSGMRILLANEQEESNWGYRIGQIEIEPLINPITGKELKVENCLKEWLQNLKKTDKE